MNKITNIENAALIASKSKAENKIVGLITGCFDVIHFGHIDYFRFAKKNCDLLIVGLDNDENIKKNKGGGRPIFNFQQRAKILSEMLSIDYIFEIDEETTYNSDSADNMLENIIKKIKPNFIVCHGVADPALERKKQSCQKYGIDMLLDKSKKINSSTEIIEIIRNIIQ